MTCRGRRGEQDVCSVVCCRWLWWGRESVCRWVLVTSRLVVRELERAKQERGRMVEVELLESMLVLQRFRMDGIGSRWLVLGEG